MNMEESIFPAGDSKSNFYTIFYDESNNARKFYIRNDFDIFNLQNDPNQEAKYHFCLAGVAYRGAGEVCDPSQLIASLKITDGKGNNELKLRRIAQGDFLKISKSEKLLKLFKWLVDSDFLIHYFDLNMRYWSFVDIVEDCVFYCGENGLLDFSGVPYKDYVDYHKDVLNEVIKNNSSEFIKLAKTFGYPSLDGRPAEFVSSLWVFVGDYRGRLLIENRFRDNRHLNGLQSLIELLELCLNVDDLFLTREDEEGELINSFTLFYHARVETFRNSIHVFDEEFEVEEELKNSRRLHPDLDKVDFRFENSANSNLIQLSDVVAGVFGKYFSFLDSNELEELKNIRSKLNKYQLEFLDLMRVLIERTDDECPLFLYYVTSLTEREKHKYFMFPDVE